MGMSPAALITRPWISPPLVVAVSCLVVVVSCAASGELVAKNISVASATERADKKSPGG
jgi:hypothetical protein